MNSSSSETFYSCSSHLDAALDSEETNRKNSQVTNIPSELSANDIQNFDLVDKGNFGTAYQEEIRENNHHTMNSSSEICYSCTSQLAGASNSEEINKTKQVANILWNIPSKISTDDFEPLHLLGKGSFGTVYQVMKKNGQDMNQMYAMKVLDKKKIIRSEITVRHTITENEVLMRIKHPFIVELFYVFQDSAHIFYILEYLCGGELSVILNQKKILSEDAASFYIKELVIGLEYLHSHGIVYRDLKPGNIMLDIQGHVKIIDFGLSKKNMDEAKVTYTICGSLPYIAPEVISREGYGISADWWSLGILFYLMIVGKKPFQVNKNTLSQLDYSNYTMPQNLSSEAKSLIGELLEVNQVIRLGSCGASKIQKHEFFRGTCWTGVAHRKETPPFLPNFQNENEGSNCDIMKSTFYCDDDSLFKRFNYVCPSLLEHHVSLTKHLNNVD